jgi:outer membrane protein assembly factor BamB
VTRALALAAALVLAGCSTYNPLVALGIKSEPANKPTPLKPITDKVGAKVAWTVSVGKSIDSALVPAVRVGRVYAAAADGTLMAVEEDTGRVASRTELKKKVSGGVEFAGGRVLLGTAKGEVIALDPAGKPLWSTQLAGEVIAPPAVAKTTVVVRTSDGRIFGLAEADGKRRWVYQRPAPALLLRTSAGVLTAAGDVLAGYPNGKLIALDGEDGKLTWEVTVSPPRGTTELERIADVGGLPVIDGGNVCAAAYQGKVACFEIQSRNMVWSKDISSSRTLAKDAKNLYVVDDNGAVHALDKSTGASAWKNDLLMYRHLTEPVVTRSLVLVGDVEGYVHALSPEDGAIVGRIATDGSQVNAIVPTAGGVVVQTAKGSLVMVRL